MDLTHFPGIDGAVKQFVNSPGHGFSLPGLIDYDNNSPRPAGEIKVAAANGGLADLL